ncbi:MAG: hypothetical protein J7M25_17300 [Deltaproteobacteria bacterium]|nr:hypothetical protein [Deltaproteobacteria bacterium]
MRRKGSLFPVKRKGQGMTEYIIIVALIAIAAIAIITLFGNNIRALFGAASDATTGKTDVTPQTQKSQVQMIKGKSLKNFASMNAP